MPRNTREALDSIPPKFLDQYTGCWAIEETRAQALTTFAAQLNLAQHLVQPVAFDSFPVSRMSVDSGSRRGGYLMTDDGVAVIEMCGVMTKYGSSFSEFPGCVNMRRALRAAANDAAVNAIMLLIDSPGGSTAGVVDLADDVKAIAAMKPVHAYIEDCGASAAYLVASQATRRVCNRSAIVGSIGTYLVVMDFSAMAEKDGVKVHVVRAGEFKGAGTPGTAVTDEQLSEFQRLVDTVNSFFIKAIESGLKISSDQAKQLADGRVHIGNEAKALGLVDAVASFDQALADLQTTARQPNKPTASPRGEAIDTPLSLNPIEETAMSKPKPKSEDAPKKEEETTEEETVDETEQEEEEVETEEEEMEEEPKQTKARKGKGTVASKPATIAELKAALPESTADFRETCIEQGLTVAQAKGMYQLAGKSAQQSKPKPGNKPLGSGNVGAGASATGDAVDQFQSLVDQKLAARPGMDRSEAHKQVCREHPDLREAMVEAHNEKHARRGRRGAA